MQAPRFPHRPLICCVRELRNLAGPDTIGHRGLDKAPRRDFGGLDLQSSGVFNPTLLYPRNPPELCQELHDLRNAKRGQTEEDSIVSESTLGGRSRTFQRQEGTKKRVKRGTPSCRAVYDNMTARKKINRPGTEIKTVRILNTTDDA